MRVGYGFWGFLGDKKYGTGANGPVEISTPDGNAFYSWSIIEELLHRGNDVFSIMPDRDAPGYGLLKQNLFASWATKARNDAYLRMEDGTKEGSDCQQCKLDFVLWEWRWIIPGRNDNETKEKKPAAFQLDYELQHYWLTKFKQNHVPVIVFDLDYKLGLEDIMRYNIAGVVELGNKWQNNPFCHAKRVQIPFNFRYIHEFDIVEAKEPVVYVGNRYERDWCVDKYLPEGTIVYGNWLESERDSKNRWPNLIFRPRLQTAQMRSAYAVAGVTPLLAKQSYCDEGFMTARVIEAVFYGCVPLFIEEFKGAELYIPEKWRNALIVSSKSDVQSLGEMMVKYPEKRKEIIYSMRFHLSKFMGAKHFVNDLFEIVKDL